MTRADLKVKLLEAEQEIRRLRNVVGTLEERVRFTIGEHNEMVLKQHGNTVRIETYKQFSIRPIAGNAIELVFEG